MYSRAWPKPKTVAYLKSNIGQVDHQDIRNMVKVQLNMVKDGHNMKYVLPEGPIIKCEY